MAFFEGFEAAGALGVDSFFVLDDLTAEASFFFGGFVTDAFLGGGFDAISGLLLFASVFSPDFSFFSDVRGLSPVASGISSSPGGGGVS